VGRFWFLVLLLGVGAIAPSFAHAKKCSSDEGLAPGVRLPDRAGCKARRHELSPEAKPRTARAGREPGFIDAGNGLQVRIGGRVDFEAGHRRR
jgi:hypothetical protein